jgi:hypothetical protein
MKSFKPLRRQWGARPYIHTYAHTDVTPETTLSYSGQFKACKSVWISRSIFFTILVPSHVYCVHENVKNRNEKCCKSRKYNLGKDGHSRYKFSNTSNERGRNFNFLSDGIVSFGVLMYTYNYNHSQPYGNISCHDKIITNLLVLYFLLCDLLGYV